MVFRFAFTQGSLLTFRRIFVIFSDAKQRSVRPFPKAEYLLVVVKYVFEARMDFRKVGYVSSAYFLNEVKKRGESL